MPFTKTFGSTSGAYSTETLWEKISLRSQAFSWTASGSGTGEFYVRTAAGGDPGFVSSPTTNLVFLNGVAAASGSLGSLTAGQFGFGDNDSLGYSTLYVRLADDADPDSKVDGWVKFQQLPKAGEHVRFAPTSGSINSATGLDQSGVAIGDFIVEDGYSGSIGSASLGYLIVDPNLFEFSGSGECWLDLFSAAIAAQIYKTASAAEGERGLYLKGTAFTVVNIMGGDVGLAVRPGEVSTITTARVMGGNEQTANLWLGNGCSLTNLHQYEGETLLRCGTTAIILYGGKITSQEDGAHTAVTQYGGEFIYMSSGNITTYNLHGGLLDLQKSGAARTISTLNKYRGAAQILHNKEAVTITTETRQETFNEIISV